MGAALTKDARRRHAARNAEIVPLKDAGKSNSDVAREVGVAEGHRSAMSRRKKGTGPFLRTPMLDAGKV